MLNFTKIPSWSLTPKTLPAIFFSFEFVQTLYDSIYVLGSMYFFRNVKDFINIMVKSFVRDLGRIEEFCAVAQEIDGLTCILDPIHVESKQEITNEIMMEALKQLVR